MRGGQASKPLQWEAWEALEIWLFSPPAKSLLSGTGVTALAPRGVSQPLASLSCKMAECKNLPGSHS